MLLKISVKRGCSFPHSSPRTNRHKSNCFLYQSSIR